MINILILSNFFPPTKLTPSERIYSWAKYFNKFGLYPIVITRIWPENTTGYESSVRNAGDEIRVEKHPEYEVHYLPYENDMNEKLSLRWGNGKLHTLYRIVLFLNYFIEPLFLFRTSPFYNKLYQYAIKIIKEKNIQKILISAAPFMLFKVGYKLKKKLKNIDLFADYRDDWTTSDICFNPNQVKALEIVRSYQKHFEKKWLSQYKLFFTVSDNYVDKIKSLIKIPGYVAENGFLRENYTSENNKLNDVFTITYVGYIYSTQPIEIFLKAIENLILNEKLDVKINFIGLKDQEVQYKRIQALITQFSDKVNVTARLNKDICIEMQQNSHILLQVGHKGIKGSPGSKMYEYLALKKPVLVCPSDGDIVESTLKNSGQAFIANTEQECIEQIKLLTQMYHQGQKLQTNDDYINNFDREYIAQKMVKIILSNS